MKKITLLFMAMVVAISAAAGVTSNKPLKMIDTKGERIKIEKSESSINHRKVLQASSDKVITEIPEGCEVKTYFRNSGTILYHWLIGIYARPTAGKFTIAIDPATNDAYIQDPIWYFDTYDTWIKGSYDPATGTIIIPTGQFIYWDDETQYGIEIDWGSSYAFQSGEDEEGNPEYMMDVILDERTTEIYMQIVGDEVYLLNTEGSIYAQFPEWGNTTCLLALNTGNDGWEALEFANHIGDYEMPFGELANIVPAVPAAPTADEWYDCGSEVGFSELYITLPQTDIDGNKIDFELLSYSVYVDNGNGPELFVFEEKDYYYDTEGLGDLTEIPYSVFYGGYDLTDYGIFFYRTNAPGYEPLFTENIGVQAIYTVDGVKNVSEIGWLYPVTTSADVLNADKTVASVRYYNVAGQQVAQPSGLTIQVTTYTDGTTSAVKVVK